MEEKFNEIANEYDKWFETPVGRIVKELELNALLEAMGEIKDKKILEVGIGTGLFAMEFRKRGADVIGIDPAENMLKIAKSRGFEVKFGYGEAIPFEENSFDIVLSMTSMENSKNPEKFVGEMVRVAKPEGKIVVAVLNAISLYGISRRIRGLFDPNDLFKGMHFYNFWELKNLLKKHLCNVEVNSSVFFNPSPPKFTLDRANALEKFGRKYLKPFGALLIGGGIKCL
ncbi:MAG TPA: SAM-dependent methyltransferase [Thermodesulfobium narugense]|nr:SAM-dependent methyltransferase [Thermodesulfobium narugense]